MMTAVGDSSRTAAMPGSSADADTRTAASNPVAPLDAAAALGAQPQAMRDYLGPGQRHPAQFQGDQAAHGVDVEVIVEFNVVQFRDIFDRQPRGNPKPLVTQVFYWGRLRLVVLVGDLSDDFF